MCPTSSGGPAAPAARRGDRAASRRPRRRVGVWGVEVELGCDGRRRSTLTAPSAIVAPPGISRKSQDVRAGGFTPSGGRCILAPRRNGRRCVNPDRCTRSVEFCLFHIRERSQSACADGRAVRGSGDAGAEPCDGGPGGHGRRGRRHGSRGADDATPVADQPVTDPPAAGAPVTETPVTEPPVTETPTTEAPAPPPSTVDPTVPPETEATPAPAPAPVATDPGTPSTLPGTPDAPKATVEPDKVPLAALVPDHNPSVVLPPVAPKVSVDASVPDAPLCSPRPRPRRATRRRRSRRRCPPRAALCTRICSRWIRTTPVPSPPFRLRRSSRARGGLSRAGSPTRPSSPNRGRGRRWHPVGLQPAGGAGRLRAAGCRRSAGHHDHHVHAGRADRRHGPRARARS